MLTCCNTARGRIACGLGGVLIAVLALACLWAFSPSVTAGDDPLLPRKANLDIPRDGEKLPKPPSSDPPPTVCPVPPGLPLMPPVRAVSGAVPPLPPAPPKPDVATSPPPPPDLPPTTGSGKPAPLPPVEPGPPPPEGSIAPAGALAPVPQAQPPVDTQDVKQLVAHLSEIRADRAKLDEKERQTIQTIRRKYQEQKHALEQVERELRQLGINCDEAAPDKAPVRPTGSGQ